MRLLKILNILYNPNPDEEDLEDDIEMIIEKYEAESSTQKIEELLKQERSKMSDKDKLDLLREFNY